MKDRVVTERPPKGLLLHCGGKLVSRQELWTVPTPSRTRSWYPLPHRSVLNEIEVQLQGCGFTITEQAHALSHDGDRYFGVMTVTLPERSIT